MPAIKLDKSRPFGSVRGHVDGYIGARYTQDGHYFSGTGELARKEGEAAVDMMAEAEAMLDAMELDAQTGTDTGSGTADDAQTGIDTKQPEAETVTPPAKKPRARKKPAAKVEVETTIGAE